MFEGAFLSASVLSRYRKSGKSNALSYPSFSAEKHAHRVCQVVLDASCFLLPVCFIYCMEALKGVEEDSTSDAHL